MDGERKSEKSALSVRLDDGESEKRKRIKSIEKS